MNRKGFTLIELLTTLLILGVIVSLSVVMVRYNTENSMKKSEEVFIDTLRDAINIYIDSDGRNMDDNSDVFCTIDKALGRVNIYEKNTTINFNTIANSKFKPILKKDIVNPANEDVLCNVKTSIRIFRDSDSVYYYLFDGNDMGCLKYNKNNITNLPEGCI